MRAYLPNPLSAMAILSLILALAPGGVYAAHHADPSEPWGAPPATTALPAPLGMLSEDETAERLLGASSERSASSAEYPQISYISQIFASWVAAGWAGRALDLGLAAVSASAAPQADAESVELVGAVGGFSEAVAVQGDYAYIGQGYTLVVLDIADPASPSLVGRSPPLPSIVKDVALSGDHAYVVGGDSHHAGWLRVVDVSDPTNPKEVWHLDYESSDQSGKGVAVAGDYLYVIAGLGLRVVDVSDPDNPIEIGEARRSIYGNDVAVAGEYAYVAAGGALRVIDISDPGNLTGVGSCGMPGPSAVSVTVSPAGDTVYVANWEEGLRVVDVSDPTNPTHVGSYRPPGWAKNVHDVTLSGPTAYITTGDDLRVIDVSDPTNPTEVGWYPTPGLARAVAVAPVEGYAYVADGDMGLRVVDVSDIANPTEVGYYAVLGEPRGVAVAGDYVYATNGGLWVVDISSPAGPHVVGHAQTGRDLNEVAVIAEGHVCVTGDDAGLRVVDVSDPTNPTEVGASNVSGGDLAASRDTAYVAVGEALRVVDVSDPANPIEVGCHRVPEEIRSVAVGPARDYAYIATGEDLRVIDVSDPAHPAEVGLCSECGTADDLAIAPAGDYVYAAIWGDGLRVVDVSDPANPTEVGGGPANSGCGAEIALAGDAIYIVGAWWKEWKRLIVVDVSDPSDPREVGRDDHRWRSVGGVAATGGCAMIAAGGAGLLIVRFTAGKPAPPPEATLHASPSPTSGPPPTPQPRGRLCPGVVVLLPLLLFLHIAHRPQRPRREAG